MSWYSPSERREMRGKAPKGAHVNKIHIEARQTGKTTKLAEEFVRCWGKSGELPLVFCANRQMAHNFIDRVMSLTPSMQWSKHELEKFISPARNSMINDMPDMANRTVLVDEYLFMRPEEQRVLMALYQQQLRNCKWTIRTTSNKLYRRDIIAMVEHLKGRMIGSHIVTPFMTPINVGDIEEIEKLLLSEPSFKIENRDWQWKAALSPEQYELEVLGKFLVDQA